MKIITNYIVHGIMLAILLKIKIIMTNTKNILVKNLRKEVLLKR